MSNTSPLQKFTPLLIILLLWGAAAKAQSYFDGIRLCWDYSAQKYLCGGVYSRLKMLSDSTLDRMSELFCSRLIAIFRGNRARYHGKCISLQADN